MKRMYLLTLLLSAFFNYSNAQDYSVTSPDGLVNVIISVEDSIPSYTLIYKGKTFLEKSPLGMKTDFGDFSKGMILNPDHEITSIDESYELGTIKQSRVHYLANQGVFTFMDGQRPAFDVIFRVSNNDVGFKYLIHNRRQTLSCVVLEEATGFKLPAGTTTFLCPQSTPMGGFARSTPSYETPYKADAPMGENGRGEGYTFPCLFREGDNGWLLISETGVSSKYCGSRLMGHPDGLYTIGFPMERENNGNGTVSPGISLPGETPWRTLTFGETLAPIVETTIPFSLVKPLYEPSMEFVYGKGSWSWIIGMDPSTNYDEQVRYIDFSAAMGYQTVLVDALWDKQIGRDRIVDLARYAESKGVALFLWYNSNGYWNDAPQSPRGIMDNTVTRRNEMKWLQSIGIRGLKVDFFGGDKQVTMQFYEDILADANDFGLMIIFHGCTLPRGWERMYPNFATAEAVLASENMSFNQASCDAEAFNACLHPFIRNTVGSMDFGGSTLNKFYNSKNSSEARGTRRVTSDVFALATAVLFQSPVQHFAMAPNNLTDAPEWAIDFMKKVPSTWDETRFIDGYPGRYVVLARRKASEWYIAAINAQKETLNLKVKLPMLAPGEILYYSDSAGGNVKLLKYRKDKDVEITVPSNGGAVIIQ